MRSILTPEQRKVERRPNFSLLALVSFIASFAVARTFTTFNSGTHMEILETHIHHFWYGIILLAVSGWLGIHYNSDLIDSVAAVLYGIGGGLIMDEVALLLKLDPQAYWFDVTYTMTLIFLAFVSCLVLLSRYSAIIHEHFVAKRVSLYIGLVLTAISTAVITETTNIVIIAISIALVIAGCIIALTYFVHRVRSIDRSSLSTRQLL